MRNLDTHFHKHLRFACSSASNAALHICKKTLAKTGAEHESALHIARYEARNFKECVDTSNDHS